MSDRPFRCQVTIDLGHLLSFVRVSNRFVLQRPHLLSRLLHGLCLLQGSAPTLRQLRTHVEYEQKDYLNAYLLQMELCVSCLPLLRNVFVSFLVFRSYSSYFLFR